MSSSLPDLLRPQILDLDHPRTPHQPTLQKHAYGQHRLHHPQPKALPPTLALQPPASQTGPRHSPEASLFLSCLGQVKCHVSMAAGRCYSSSAAKVKGFSL